VTGGPDADAINPGKGRDTVHARDGAVDTVECGRGDDIVRNDPFEFLLGCERSDAYASASPVPLAIQVADNGTTVSLSLGCRENHPASCTGTAQLEFAGEAVGPELAFNGPNRYRFGWVTEAGRPLPPGAEHSDDLVVRVRSQDSAGVPTNDAFSASMLLSASLLFV
jgi:hypothetical protein